MPMILFHVYPVLHVNTDTHTHTHTHTRLCIHVYICLCCSVSNMVVHICCHYRHSRRRLTQTHQVTLHTSEQSMQYTPHRRQSNGNSHCDKVQSQVENQDWQPKPATKRNQKQDNHCRKTKNLHTNHRVCAFLLLDALWISSE